jgi:tRNA(Arg) A34 adenosine deaminase TadA
MLTDEDYLRRAIELARDARSKGEDPFGAVLTDGSRIVYESHNQERATFDPTCHAELNLIREYCRANNLLSLEGYTIYSSTEPCVMCAGAIGWARVSRVVFSVSQAMLQQVSGGNPKPSLASLLSAKGRPTEIVGPLLPEEGMAVFDGYVFREQGTKNREQG